jgi:TatD DNase family protein
LYRELTATHPKCIHYTVGLHPCHVKEGWQLELEDLINRLRRADDHPPVAIGEIGLDYFHLPKETEARMQMVAMQKGCF